MGQPVRPPRVRTLRSQQAACLPDAEHQLPHAAGVLAVRRSHSERLRETAAGVGQVGKSGAVTGGVRTVMADLRYIVRYFQVVPPVHRLMVLSFAVLTMGGGLLTVGNGTNAAAAVPILVLQAFGVSTGFAVLAR